MVLPSSWCAILLFPFLRLIIAAPTTGIDVMVVDPKQTGCLYDNKLFGENQVIHTKEPCLACSCQQNKLSCKLQVCPYIDEGSLYPPPAGCILVERKGACCPKLHCPTPNPGGNRLLRKDPTGQITAWKARDELRKRLVKQLSKNGTEKIGCVEGGTLYAEGSAMMTSSTCEYCFCLKGKQNCVKPRCASPPMEGCTPRFQKELACCPTHYVCDNSTETLKNTSTAFTKKVALIGSSGIRHRPLVVSKIIPPKQNDRLIDSSKDDDFKSQEILNNHEKTTIVKREAQTNNATSNRPLQNVDEVIISTQKSMSSIVSTPSSMTSMTTSTAATAVDEKTFVVERTANDLNQDTTEPQGDHYPNSITTKESSMDDSAPATSSEIVMVTTLIDPTSFTETPTGKTDDRMLISSTTEHEEEEESSSTNSEDESTDSLISFTSQRRADNVEQQLDHDEENEEAEAAERAIEVSVSSSISSVSFSQTGPTNHTTEDTSKSATPTSNFFPINSKGTTSSAVKPLVPVPVKNEDHDDYDYDNMELPPSLPNLEIIPFVAADAVHGVPSNFDDDERLSLGGLSTNQQLTHPIVSEDRNDTSNVSEDNNKNDVSLAKMKPESKISSPPQTVAPIQAFKVTFPPRSSSTPRPTSPSVFLNRFTLKRTTTQRTTVTPLPTTRSKLNKPTVNNLLGSSSVGLTGGLRIEGCNIYGQIYRVGRIIDELSGPCIECKCTEIGVNCNNLKC